MSNPIPGDDAERTSFEKAMNAARFLPRELDFAMTKSPSGRDEYANTHLESCWVGWQARASAPVGANVAASALLKLCDQLDTMKLRLRAIPGEGQRESYYVADDVNCYVEEARAHWWWASRDGGGLAETVKQEPVAWMVFAGDYGVLNPQFPARALRADAERDALLYGQTPTEVRPLYAAMLAPTNSVAP